MNENEFTSDSHELKSKLLKEAARLTDKIDTLERTTEDHTAYYGYLKDFLINSGCLCDDILQALHNDAALLGMIGTRSLLEDAINVHYLETKPTDAERMALAQDWFRISNDPEAYKNKLDNKRVDQRAEVAGADTKALCEGEYADFCNYTHGTAQRGILNMPAQRKIISNKAVLATLKAYANIVTCVARIIGEPVTPTVTDAAEAYFDKYRASVTEAHLPPLENQTTE